MPMVFKGAFRVLSGKGLADNRFVQHTNSFPPLSHTPHALRSPYLPSCACLTKQGAGATDMYTKNASSCLEIHLT
jgi:hypothetical protein